MIIGDTAVNSLKYGAKFFLCLILFVSCQNEELYDELPDRTVIVYMVADNNLDYFAVKDINEMEAGFNDNVNGNLIVYVDRAKGASPSHPVVYKISNDTTENITSEISFVYGEQNSADGGVVSDVISDITSKFPAKSYGLVLWSHGTAWYPAGTVLNDENDISSRLKQLPLIKSFGKDGSDEMNIPDLKKSLPVHFEFIIFDACYMASIEVAYELRNCTDYIIASPTEVLSAGFPYSQISNSLFDPVVDYTKVATYFFNSYDTLSNALKSASISVIKTSKLNDLAIQVSSILNDIDNIKKVNTSELQQYTVNKANYLFDIDDFISYATTNRVAYEAFEKTLTELVVYKASTPKILDELEINKFSGLSIYVLDESNFKYYDYYKTLDWYKDCNYNNYFNLFDFPQ